MMGFLQELIPVLLGLVLLWMILEAILEVVLKPYLLTSWFGKQGVKGPPYKLMKGCLEEIKAMKEEGRRSIMDVHSHDFTSRVFPHYLKWSSEYGKTFVYWVETRPRICVTDVEIVKQVLSDKFGFYTKEKPRAPMIALLGRGLIFTEGSDWARHRRLISPAFTMNKLKAMAKRMVACTQSMMEEWQEGVMDGQSKSVQMEMSKQFQELTANVISCTAFGDCHVEGRKVFEAQKELQILAAASILNGELPGYRYLPTKTNRKRWEIERTVKDTLTQMIKGRLDCSVSKYENDLLGLMMESYKAHPNEGSQLDMDEIIDECKTFFFAGHETTSHLLTWTVFLLASNQEWQEKLRDEVIRECGTDIPDADTSSKLKLVTMVLLEALRLYSPVIIMVRRSTRDMMLGNIEIPKNTSVTIPIPLLHRSKEIWGDDANEFNPCRFKNGISKAAKHPNALISFSLGPRSCVGQNFAMLEAKIVISMILQRFSFSLSPDYKHAPVDILTLQPQFGLPIIVKSLKA